MIDIEEIFPYLNVLVIESTTEQIYKEGGGFGQKVVFNF